jgi:hypothetical protein
MPTGHVRRAPLWPESEVELGEAVVRYLKAEGWEVTAEVQARRAYGPIFDIVATRRPLVWIVELKRTLTFALLDQARAAHDFAHIVSVAVPEAHCRRRGGRYAATDYMVWKGIGRLDVSRWYEHRVTETLRPRLNRKPLDIDAMKATLTDPLQSVCPPGTANGGHMTEFGRTCQRVREYVRKQPGRTIKQLVEDVTHHYANAASARSSIAAWIRNGYVEGVEARREGRRVLFYPKGDKR